MIQKMELKANDIIGKPVYEAMKQDYGPIVPVPEFVN